MRTLPDADPTALADSEKVLADLDLAVPGVTRTFDSFGAAEKEASLSRVFAGVHFRSDEDAGEALGRSVADFVTDHALRAVHDDRDDPYDDR